MCAPAVLPCPAFEGSEKRISVSFAPLAGELGCGLRGLSRAELDVLMESAACLIVSARHHASHDAYVLSESSCFVYPDRIVLKTCGTTKLLACVPLLLRLAGRLGLAPRAVKYSRASFLFPEAQPEEHASFEAETAVLRTAFAALPRASSYVLGDALNGLQWHVFAASAGVGQAATAAEPLHTFEVCMTGLSPAKAAQFFRGEEFVDSREVTVASGIQDLIPRAVIDDYVFEPCGYSMNAVEGDAFSTIHITPEAGFSYASFELCGRAAAAADTAALLHRVVTVFEPEHVAVALSVDGAAAPPPDLLWAARGSPPPGYACHTGSFQELRGGGCVAFFSLDREDAGLGLGGCPGLIQEQMENLCAVNEPDHADALSVRLAVLTTGREDLTSALTSGVKPAAGSSEGGSPRGVLPPHDLTCSVLTDLDALEAASVAASSTDEPPSDTACDPAAVVRAEFDVATLPAGGIETHAAGLIASQALDDTFYVVDLGRVAGLLAAWRQALPRVTPCFAVKAFPDPGVLSVLGALGSRFDCASAAEVDAVLARGVSASRIILANACKRPVDVRAGRDRGVPRTTFDSLTELDKLAAAWPEAELLLRVRADAPAARCPLGNKYGAEAWEWEALACRAAELGLRVQGVAFHVGSGAGGDAAAAYAHAVTVAADAAAVLRRFGFEPRVLDVGGGFPGGSLTGIAPVLAAALDEHWPAGPGVEVIAEPGRYFAEPAATLFTSVFGKRVRGTVGDGSIAVVGDEILAPEDQQELFVSDGLYGSMNCILYDHASPVCQPLPGVGCCHSPDATLVPTTVFGPTCDGLDTILRGFPLPNSIGPGDWLVWPGMGAYTLCGASTFNGMDAVGVPRFYVWSTDDDQSL